MRSAAALLSLTMLLAPVPAAAQRSVPYWASIAPSEARMRSGPGREFPAQWLYRRPGLPVRVVQTYKNWRRVADADGTTGWMQSNMVSERRTAIVRGGLATMRTAPEGGATVTYRAEPGVIGRVSRCADGWCLFDVGGKRGYLPTDALWGVDRDERID